MLAFDRSMRTFDLDGRMHVEQCNISKATVSPYYGREIPNAGALGLDPDRVYRLLRDPMELQKGASTFTNLPLLERHVAISANVPRKELWVGTTGIVSFQAPYLVARPLSVWTADAIKLIVTRKREQLSSSYHYVAYMTPGSYMGVAYDGVMRHIKGNHVAIVSEGRVGPENIVSDENPPEFKFMRPEQLAVLKPFLLPDADLVALDAAMDEVDGAEDAELTAEEKKAAKDEAMKAKDGKDLDADEEKACYAKAKDRKAKDRKAARDAKKAKDSVNTSTGRAPEGGAPNPAAKDENTMTPAKVAEAIKLASDAAVVTATANVTELFTAREVVKPLVGVVALDSAEAVYTFALDKRGVACKNMPTNALRALVEAELRAVKAPGAVAQDAQTVAQGGASLVNSIFPRS